MNKIYRFFIFISYLYLCGILLFSSCTQQIVSGTEVGNPPTVSGRVHDVENNAVSNAAVFLVTPDYNPIFDSIGYFDTLTEKPETDSLMTGNIIYNAAGDIQRIFTRTNDKGEFVIDSVMSQVYNLFITDSEGSRINFTSGIAVEESQVDLGICEIKAVGYATIMISDSIYESNSYISIPGTPIKRLIDSAGEYTVPVISDSITVNYYDMSGDSLTSILNNQPIPSVNPGDTINLTGIETILIPPTVVAIVGNDTLYPPIESIDAHDTLIHVAAFGAIINRNSEIEYQFYEATGEILSQWSSDSIYPLPITFNSQYSVACRVRSKSDTTDVTGWTSSLLIRINEFSDSIIIPAPLPPVVIDTLQLSDSTFYYFLVTDSSDNHDIVLDYRIQWSDTTENSGISQWSQDSIFSICFTSLGIYEIRAQARSVEDTSQMSLWSGSLFFSVSP